MSARGFGLLIQKLSLEGVNGIRPLLPEPRFGQDVAMVAFVIDELRRRHGYYGPLAARKRTRRARRGDPAKVLPLKPKAGR